MHNAGQVPHHFEVWVERKPIVLEPTFLLHLKRVVRNWSAIYVVSFQFRHEVSDDRLYLLVLDDLLQPQEVSRRFASDSLFEFSCFVKLAGGKQWCSSPGFIIYQLFLGGLALQPPQLSEHLLRGIYLVIL